MPAPKRLIYDAIRGLLNPDRRFVDIAFRFRLQRRLPNGGTEPGELRPRVYGGRYDVWARRYVGEPDTIVEIPCTPGQIELLEFDEPGVYRVLAMGPPGGGKSMAAALRGVRQRVDNPHSVGGITAPTRPRVDIMMQKFLDVVQPLGWVQNINLRLMEVRLVNGAVSQFRGTKKSSGSVGAPTQGLDWDDCIEDEQQDMTDEACREHDFRGRRRGLGYKIFSTATNQMLAGFQRRLETYRSSSDKKVIAFSGSSNVFVEQGFWDAQKDRLSAEDYRRLILGEDVPFEGVIYPRFGPATTRPIPPGMRDVTAEEIAKMWPAAEWGHKKLIAGQDWGARTQATVFLRCLEDSATRSRTWWVGGELVSDDAIGTARHAQMVTQWLHGRGLKPGDVIVLADPHLYKDSADSADVSDYNLFRQAGFTTLRASGQRINRRHRFAMVNALLEDANGVRRLFIEREPSGLPCAPRLVQSFRAYQYGPTGEPQQWNKDRRDESHTTDALGYALWQFERVRGGEYYGSKDSERGDGRTEASAALGRESLRRFNTQPAGSRGNPWS